VEPRNLGDHWVGYDFDEALGKPTRWMNDAAMQALGSHQGGTMLFLGMGTGLGAALVLPDGTAVPLEFAHLPSWIPGKTFEDLTGWRRHQGEASPEFTADVQQVVERLRKAVGADYVVLGGGDQRLIADEDFPPDTLRGGDAYAHEGGFRFAMQDISENTGQVEGSSAASEHPALEIYRKRAHLHGGDHTMIYYGSTPEDSVMIVRGRVLPIDLEALPFDAAHELSFSDVPKQVGTTVWTGDPRDEIQGSWPTAERAAQQLQAATNADYVILGRGWGEFRHLTVGRDGLLRGPDGRASD
jgi:hypothetical protein